jgi:Beta-ketoacyl synthase, N-terminal domain
VRLYVEGVGLRGPGLAGWAASRPVLTGTEPYIPTPAIVPPSPLLPPNERRRTVQTVKLALAVGMEAFRCARRDVAETPTVFASSGGDGDTLHEILSVLASEHRELSPTRFHNSVHNAPAGYWNIATHSHAPSCSLCAYDASFAAGMLEAAVQTTVNKCPVGLIAYDMRYPEPLNSVRPIGALFGVALVLTPRATEASLARLDVQPRRHSGCDSGMASAELEDLRKSTPAARSLPILAALAQNEPVTLVVEYIPPLKICLSLEPVASKLASDGDDGDALTEVQW